MGLAHYADAVVVGLKGNDAVVAHAETLAGAVEVDVLAGDAQQPGIGVYGFLPLHRAAAKGAGAVVHAFGHADAEAVGAAAPLAPGFDFVVVNAVQNPDELLGFHQVERDAGNIAQPVGNQALGRLADDGRLDHVVVGPVAVNVRLLQVEMAQVVDEGVLLVKGEDAILDGAFNRGFPRLGQQAALFG